MFYSVCCILLHVFICLTFHWDLEKIENILPRKKNNVINVTIFQVDGCTSLKINLIELKRLFSPIRSQWSDYHITINANVKETSTGIRLHAMTFSEQLMKTDVELTIETKSVFKPGFPHQIKVSIFHLVDLYHRAWISCAIWSYLWD